MPAVLDLAAVGAYLGRRRPDGEPLTAKTISVYITESRPDSGGRYEGHPFPEPSGYLGRGEGQTRGGVPYWLPDRLGDLEEWDDARLGRGAGGGRPPRIINCEACRDVPPVGFRCEVCGLLRPRPKV